MRSYMHFKVCVRYKCVWSYASVFSVYVMEKLVYCYNREGPQLR